MFSLLFLFPAVYPSLQPLLEDVRKEAFAFCNNPIHINTFTVNAAFIWSAPDRRVLHRSDPCPWTKRHNFPFYTLYSAVKRSRLSNRTNMFFFIHFLHKENQETKGKKELPAGQEELDLREKWVNYVLFCFI